MLHLTPERAEAAQLVDLLRRKPTEPVEPVAGLVQARELARCATCRASPDASAEPRRAE